MGLDDDPASVYLPRKAPLSDAIPVGLCKDFAEAQRAFTAKCYLATVVLVRRVVEGACLEQQATKWNLDEKIKQLETAGKLDGRLAGWATVLRRAGNNSAHTNKPRPTREDAEDALHFGEAFLDHLYVLNARLEAFERRNP